MKNANDNINSKKKKKKRMEEQQLKEEGEKFVSVYV